MITSGLRLRVRALAVFARQAQGKQGSGYFLKDNSPGKPNRDIAQLAAIDATHEGLWSPPVHRIPRRECHVRREAD